MHIENVYSKGNFKLVHQSKASDIYVSGDDFSGVVRAAKDLRDDVNRVSRVLPQIKNDLSPLSEHAVIIGTLGKSTIIDELIKDGKLDVADIIGKWEAFVIQVVQNPVPGVELGLVIAGSDKRGTIFGVYHLSGKIGVSPWYWWADIPAPYQPTLVVRNGIYKEREPSVKYRGIFINDEGPSLMEWVRSNYRDFVHEFYEKVFELILRLKANYLWPAMWDSAFNEDDELNPAIADEYGVVIGTSHHEPMLRAYCEWRKHRNGPWNYASNKDVLYKFWEFGIERNKNFESTITLGMRGDGDEEMEGSCNFEKKMQLLQTIIEDQRKIIAEKMNPQVDKVPQLWALYKEVQSFYENGMRVPDDVTLLWSDDNFGNLRRVPTEEERKRQGGAGIYYHFDYVGGPRSYKWINTVPIYKAWEQMHKAYEYGADRIWIVNVGDLKPMEFNTEFFLRMARNVNDFTRDNLWEYHVSWAERNFGKEYAEDIAAIIEGYAKFNGRIKPEHINMVDIYSVVNYKEADTVLEELERMVSMAEKIYGELPESLKDAFFQLVLYPAKASKLVNEIYIHAARTKLYAEQERSMANVLARTAELDFEADDEITFDYNKRLALGKWDHIMDQTHIGYTFWNYPPQNIMPEVKRIPLEAGADMGIAIEGSSKAWPQASENPVLYFDNFTRESHYIDIFNKKSDAFLFNIESSAAWIKVSIGQGTIYREKRIWVDIEWDAASKGQAVKGSLKISSSCGTVATVDLSVFNPAFPQRESLVGFIENDGYISIEAEHYTNKINANGADWQKIDKYGRTLSSMAVFPVTAESAVPPENSPCLEYQVYILNPGNIEVTAFLAPSLNFIPGKGVRIGVSFDDEPIQIADAAKMDEDGNIDNQDWEMSVILNTRKTVTNHLVKDAGYHTLKIWMVDPTAVLQKIVIDTGGLKPSYLGPKESFFGGKETLPAPVSEVPFDPGFIPGRIGVINFNTIASVALQKSEWLQYDVFVEHDGVYQMEIIASNCKNTDAVLHIGCDGKDITDAVAIEPNKKKAESEEFKRLRIPLQAGGHVLRLCVDYGSIDFSGLIFELIHKDLLSVRPTLRYEETQPDKQLILQLGLYNRDDNSHRCIIDTYLYDDKENLLGHNCITETITKKKRCLYNYCFNPSEKTEKYRIKVVAEYSGIRREFFFEEAVKPKLHLYTI
ncbi:glycosyl hydrolase 115 family protein [Pseudobacteroides cellulosolvens]|uniref:Gylcosyl hydrolase 115 C-terminal domain-containing protein n=1 Tax=Pseudobacteroides cellulosolvens ATCC 35603 = DSM 2933 TaxID=398512 RepID=A0A0L6JWN8_9FIRM|nr:glycosyl hydrolase 115 family protein [Pseudobacteroides cellulosolvens]KNY30261.1 hypothetical protein Bccel_5538 [Pseudobacteroides cellulosolvens ATCC 35603 = DSM 2933]